MQYLKIAITRSQAQQMAMNAEQLAELFKQLQDGLAPLAHIGLSAHVFALSPVQVNVNLLIKYYNSTGIKIFN